MIHLVPTGAHHVVGLRIEGKITADDFQTAVAELEGRLKAHDQVRVYAEIGEISGMTLEAFIKDLKYSLRHFRDVEREAVVTDSAWIEKLVDLGGALFPSIETRHFTPERRDDALRWICA
jgi:hypothetical protein